MMRLPWESVTVLTNVVNEHYFETMKVGLTRGRGFTAADPADSRRVGMVNEEFVNRYWPNQEPIGKRFRLGAGGAWIEVVGVARTGKYLSIVVVPCGLALVTVGACLAPARRAAKVDPMVALRHE